MKDRQAMSETEKFPVYLTAVAWDYRTDLAEKACEAAFAPYRGPKKSSEYLGIRHPLHMSQRMPMPIAQYDLLRQNGAWIGGVVIEQLPEERRMAVADAVLNCSFGNHDTMLFSYIDKVTGHAWPATCDLEMIHTRDFMIICPVDPGDHIAHHAGLDASGSQKRLHYPGLGVIVLPPSRSNHGALARLKSLQYATEFFRTYHGEIAKGGILYDPRTPLMVHTQPS